MYENVRKARQAHALLELASELLKEADPEGLMPSSNQVDDAAEGLEMDLAYAKEHAGE